jgi:hypothetical protein
VPKHFSEEGSSCNNKQFDSPTLRAIDFSQLSCCEAIITRIIQLLLQVMCIGCLPIAIATIVLMIPINIALHFVCCLPDKFTLPGLEEEGPMDTRDAISIAILVVIVGLPVGIVLSPLLAVSFCW